MNNGVRGTTLTVLDARSVQGRRAWAIRRGDGQDQISLRASVLMSDDIGRIIDVDFWILP